MDLAQRTDSVQQVDVLDFQYPLAGVQEIALGTEGPTLGTVQTHGIRHAGDVGSLEGESRQGRIRILRFRFRAPARGAIDDRAAALQEQLLQWAPFPATIRSRMPESQTRF
jgi:hypothetical protein